MKTLAVLFAAVLLSGCVTKNATIIKFDKEGNVIERIEGGESSAIDKITESTKNKTVIAWSSGWCAYMTASMATTEDPTPVVKMFGGKVDKGFISILKDQKNVDKIGSIIQATKQNLNITATGVKNDSE